MGYTPGLFLVYARKWQVWQQGWTSEAGAVVTSLHKATLRCPHLYIFVLLMACAILKHALSCMLLEPNWQHALSEHSLTMFVKCAGCFSTVTRSLFSLTGSPCNPLHTWSRARSCMPSWTRHLGAFSMPSTWADDTWYACTHMHTHIHTRLRLQWVKIFSQMG